MSALTDSKAVFKREGKIIRRPVAAATHIYGGALVSVNSSGNAKPSDDTAGDTFKGVAEFEVDNTAGAAGDLYVDIDTESEVLVVAAGMAASNEGETLYITDDQTVSLTPANVKCGTVSEVVSATSIWMDIRSSRAIL